MCSQHIHSTGCRGMQMGVISMPRVSLEWHHPVTDCGFRMSFTVEYLLWKWVRVEWRCGARIWFHTLSTIPPIPFYSFHLLTLCFYWNLGNRKFRCCSFFFLFPHPLLIRFMLQHLCWGISHFSASHYFTETPSVIQSHSHCISAPLRKTNGKFSTPLTLKQLHFCSSWMCVTWNGELQT